MNRFWRLVYVKRADYYAIKISKHIKNGDKVLDVGAGSGYLGEIINKKANATLVDIVDYNQTKLPLITFDGKRLPFKDNSFDVALLIAVLHHTSNPEKFLEEVKRVSKKIIIIEEVYKTILSRLFMDLWEWFWNKTTNIETYYNFHSSKGWKQIFENINMKLKYEEEFASSLKTLTMNMFVIVK